MPPKGYISVTIKKEVYDKLESLRASLGFGSISSLLVFLIESYTTNADRKREIDEIMEMIRRCLEGSSRDTVEGC